MRIFNEPDRSILRAFSVWQGCAVGKTASRSSVLHGKFTNIVDYWRGQLDARNAFRRGKLMLILEQARKGFRKPKKLNSYLLGALAAAISIPFGILGAELLNSWIVGLVLGSSLFTYTILIVQLIRRQPPLFIQQWFPRKEFNQILSINEYSGLRLDYIGGKDPQDSIDGIVHNRQGELQRILRCSLPQRLSLSAQSVLLEMLFAALSQYQNTRFQIIFPEGENGRRKEMFVIASHMIFCGEQPVGKDEAPPLSQLQDVLDRLFERLITLGIAPKVMNSFEVRQLISAELNGNERRGQTARDWRNIGNLGWEPSFRDMVLKPNDRFMLVGDRKSSTMAVEQLPENGSFEWLSAVLMDIPDAHISVSISSFNANDPLSKIRLGQKLKRHSAANQDGAPLNPDTAQMSFFLRFDGSDEYKIEAEAASARKYLRSLGIINGYHTHRQQQLQNWRATLPCAQENLANKHLIAFTQTSQQHSGRA